MSSSAVPNSSPPVSVVDYCLKPGAQKGLQIFESQDLEKGHFDVTFEIEGKQLHAHKFKLLSHSETFETMFSTRWTTPDVSIQIANRKFDDFKTFLGYLYFASVELTNDNLMVIVDMAEYYGIQRIKDKCDIWLSTREEFSPLPELYDATKRYLLTKSKAAILSYVRESCIKSPEMIGNYAVSKEIIMDIVTSQRPYASEGSLFKAVYSWAMNKHRHLANSNEAYLEAMKTEFADISPHFMFQETPKSFFADFIRPMKHIFDYDSWKAIELIFGKSQVTLKAFAKKSVLRGFVYADEKIVDHIKSLNNVRTSVYNDRSGCYWNKNCKIPRNPSELTINENVQYYLCISADYRRIALKQRSGLKDRDYLLAEMYGDGNPFDPICRISVE